MEPVRAYGACKRALMYSKSKAWGLAGQFLVCNKAGNAVGCPNNDAYLAHGACGKALVHEAVMHKHVADAKDGDAQPRSEARCCPEPRSEEPVDAEGHGRSCVHRCKPVIGLEQPLPLGVMGLVDAPACLEVVPEDLVSPPCIELHAHLHPSYNDQASQRKQGCIN